MGWYLPPTCSPKQPVVGRLKAGTALFRVHSAVFGPSQFNPTDPDSPKAGGGGRFDSPGGTPPYLYASRHPRTAIAESILRDVPFGDLGKRELPKCAVEGRCLSELRVAHDLRLLALHGEGLARAGQDAWLARCESEEYGRTRAWSSALLAWFPEVDGLEWRPRHDDDAFAVCVYEDRARGKLEVVRQLDLSRGEGLAVLRSALSRFGVVPPA